MKKVFFGPKIGYKGQRLTNFPNKKKKNVGPKKLSIRAKIDQFKKKKTFWAKKKQAGAELKKKKGFFGPKVGGKIEYNGQKLTNFKEKKDFLGQKNKLGMSLR